MVRPGSVSMIVLIVMINDLAVLDVDVLEDGRCIHFANSRVHSACSSGPYASPDGYRHNDSRAFEGTSLIQDTS